MGLPLIIDSRTVTPGTTIEADVCVVGAGPAGQTLVRELQDSGLRLVSVEAGAADGAYRADVAPSRTAMRRVIQTRFEGIGGTSTIWGGHIEGHSAMHARFAAPSALDFERRRSLRLPGWPLDLETLIPFYERAHRAHGLLPFDPPPQANLDRYGRPPRIPSQDVWLSFSPYIDRDRFGDDGRRLYEQSSIELYTSAAALDFKMSGRRVLTRIAISEEKGTFTINSRFLVVAAGGVENARLLLASARTGRGSFSNRYDMVGRHFMEHPFVKIAVLELYDDEWVERSDVFDMRLVDGVPVMASLSLSDDVRRKEGLLGLGTFLVPRPASYATEAARSLLMLRQALRDRTPLRSPARHMAAIVRAPHHVARFAADFRAGRLRYQEGRTGWSTQLEERPTTFQLASLVEQTPQPGNRVVFDRATDSFGRRLARLEWSWRPRDVRSLDRSRTLLARALAEHGIGQLRPFEPFPGLHPGWDPAHHHMGTTRMSSRARDGVVDADCRVHGTTNVFVAGSSVFPTAAGWANPTLTILALSIRLSDHIRSLA